MRQYKGVRAGLTPAQATVCWPVAFPEGSLCSGGQRFRFLSVGVIRKREVGHFATGSALAEKELCSLRCEVGLSGQQGCASASSSES